MPDPYGIARLIQELITMSETPDPEPFDPYASLIEALDRTTRALTHAFVPGSAAVGNETTAELPAVYADLDDPTEAVAVPFSEAPSPEDIRDFRITDE
jgi:hypothetical protein